MREYQILVEPRLGESHVAQITALNPGVRVHWIGRELAVLLGRGIRGAPGPEPERLAAEANLAPLFQEAEIYFGYRILPDLAARCPKLKWVHCPPHGIEHIQGDVWNGKVIITNGRGTFANSVAEVVLTMMLMFSRSILQYQAFQREQKWDRGHGDSLEGKTVGLIGVGSIGQRVAEMCRALRMRVVATKKSVEQASLPAGLVDELVPPQQLSHLLAQSDFVVICAPLTPETTNLISAEQLHAMKKSAYIINIGRGPIIDEPVLIQALQEGWIAGAGLDVFQREPLPTESPLWQLPNVIMTPHDAGTTTDHTARATRFFCENLKRYINGEPLINVLDLKRGY